MPLGGRGARLRPPVQQPGLDQAADRRVETAVAEDCRAAAVPVIVTGTLTNYCCGTTARQAYERGYQVVFGADVTATDDESRQEPELAVLRKGFALVLTAKEIADRLKAADPAPEGGSRVRAA
ncbi:isochorismatase family protein [Streptomyces sp. NBC_00062]|uniref:isochorismatase family protein n=1 Tax=Streptomyces sp. NBC_00062 TaxID=2975637 RepID=UPI002256524C|nr:isochorismatase family protein [Streptomyces sp. NBC_00062]MCX5433868.1 isochorismatase family protein [Streptomyces sp. NBC_00062]